jgi:hypothetical protein
MLMPVGAVLIVLGMAGSATACFQNDSFSSGQQASQPTGQTGTQATQGEDSGSSVVLAPLSGFCLAAGVVMMGIGVGNWKRPIPSDVRPANPWSDQPKEHGDPPKGLV